MSARDPQVLDLRARILAEVAKTPAATRAKHRRHVLLVTALGALAAVLLFMAMGGPRIGLRPLPMIAFTSGTGLLLAIALTRVAAGPRSSPLGRPRPFLAGAALAAAPLLAVALLAAATLWPEHVEPAVAARSDVGCALMSLVQGALPLLVLVVPRRGSDPVHPVVTGAALGAAAGSWSAAMAYVRCPHTALEHCLVAHVVPTLVLAALGGALGWALLRQRTS
ncbi:MAG: hypothetical protein JWP97_2664 [Labilithrix sp.]|nr:hypothetical protein [Labilithrix sp.]